MIIAGFDRSVAEWMVQRSPLLNLDSPFTAIGWANTEGRLIAGVMYDNMTAGINIDMHVAAEGKRWMTREFLGEVFRYPFVQLAVKRVTGRVAATNAAARRFDEHIGFTLEGTVREALPNGEDLLIYGMLKRECRWLEVGKHG